MAVSTYRKLKFEQLVTLTQVFWDDPVKLAEIAEVLESRLEPDAGKLRLLITGRLDRMSRDPAAARSEDRPNLAALGFRVAETPEDEDEEGEAETPAEEPPAPEEKKPDRRRIAALVAAALLLLAVWWFWPRGTVQEASIEKKPGEEVFEQGAPRQVEPPRAAASSLPQGRRQPEELDPREAERRLREARERDAAARAVTTARDAPAPHLRDPDEIATVRPPAGGGGAGSAGGGAAPARGSSSGSPPSSGSVIVEAARLECYLTDNRPNSCGAPAGGGGGGQGGASAGGGGAGSGGGTSPSSAGGGSGGGAAPSPSPQAAVAPSRPSPSGGGAGGGGGGGGSGSAASSSSSSAASSSSSSAASSSAAPAGRGAPASGSSAGGGSGAGGGGGGGSGTSTSSTPPATQQAASAPAQPEPPPEDPQCPVTPAAGRIVVVFDGSISMGLPLGVDPAREDELDEGVRRRDPAARAAYRALLAEPGFKRMGRAQDAFADAVDNLEQGVDIGLVVYQECRDIRQVGMFAAAQRGAAIDYIRALVPRGRTPLAQSLLSAATMLGGDKSSIVLVTDGREFCSGDPCAVARQIKAAHPETPVQVVDITGQARAECIAEITGGRLYQPSEAEDLARVINLAFRSAAPHCAN